MESVARSSLWFRWLLIIIIWLNFKFNIFILPGASDIEIPDVVGVCLQSHCCCCCPWLSFNIAHNMHKVEEWPKVGGVAEGLRARLGCCRVKKSERGK